MKCSNETILCKPMKRIKRIKKEIRKVSKTIGTLLNIVGEELYWMSPRGIVYARFYGGRDVRAAARVRRAEYQQRRAFYELKRRQLITMRRKGDRLIVTLTEKGLYVSLKYRMRVAKKCPPGEYVLVTFDIPEVLNRTRDQLRYLLREHDFLMLHKSVWYSNVDVLDLLQAWVDRSKARPWVYIFRGSNIVLPMKEEVGKIVQK